MTGLEIVEVFRSQRADFGKVEVGEGGFTKVVGWRGGDSVERKLLSR